MVGLNRVRMKSVYLLYAIGTHKWVLTSIDYHEFRELHYQVSCKSDVLYFRNGGDL